MAWFGKNKEEEIEDDEDEIVRLCQGCGKNEEVAIEDDEPLFKVMKQQTTDGKFEFLFCRKCYRMMKKGKMPPLIAQMQGQQRRGR